MNDLSLSDLAAVTNGRNGDGFGDGGGWWILLLFILLGGFGRGYGYGNNGGNGAGDVGGNQLYPWLNQSEQLSNGFAGVQQSLCSGFAGVNANVSNGFSQTQMAMLQGMNGIQSQLADCCCENRLATANQTATILAENCADRAALSDGVRDIIASQTAGTQRIIDQLCQDKIDAKNEEIQNLRQQLNMQTLAASQAAQNAFITQGFSNEVDALYNRLSNCPVPSMPVYGRTPIFTCPSQGCGCGA
jgi:hypothetical protein